MTGLDLVRTRSGLCLFSIQTVPGLYPVNTWYIPGVEVIGGRSIRRKISLRSLQGGVGHASGQHAGASRSNQLCQLLQRLGLPAHKAYPAILPDPVVPFAASRRQPEETVGRAARTRCAPIPLVCVHVGQFFF